MKFNRQFIVAFVSGLLMAIFLFHAYTVYTIRAVTIQNQATLAQVVGFINQATAQAGGAQVAPGADSE